ncbi:hypothetical protein BDA99DRAFT_537026 [Phascolomyces articulosus]|uniref:Uncharacterized protein n=1 Tax=Phascolomyces articulosus TaxID=60185 RepID=A0AAD5PEC0_9FUNG|nr:hypothetical protein BDA99DRAFT_537026 [Phascolomyces articulosus]
MSDINIFNQLSANLQLLYAKLKLLNNGNYQAQFEKFIKEFKIDGFDVFLYPRNSLHSLPSEPLKKNLQKYDYLFCDIVRWSNFFSPHQTVLLRIRSPHETCSIPTELDNFAGSTDIDIRYIHHFVLRAQIFIYNMINNRRASTHMDVLSN